MGPGWNRGERVDYLDSTEKSGILILYEENIELQPYRIPYSNMGSRQTTDLNIKVKTIKLSEENKGYCCENRESLLKEHPKTQNRRLKVDGFDSTKIKNFCSIKIIDTVKDRGQAGRIYLQHI